MTLVVEEFGGADVYAPQEPITSIFANAFPTFMQAVTSGFSIAIFSFGGSGCGKSQTIEGNKKEPGIILQFSDTIFNLMDSKKFSSSSNKNQLQSFNYGIKVRYLEIIDEEIIDLLAGPGNQPPNITIIHNEWEGPTVVGANWTSVANSKEMQNLFLRGQKNRSMSSNEFGKSSDKATSIFTLELFQNTELVESRETYILVSRAVFIDLPSNSLKYIELKIFIT